MSGGVAGLVSGPLLLAIPIAAAAGAVTFLSPCVLPLVPGYLSSVTGMSGASVTVAAQVGTESSSESNGPDGDQLAPPVARPSRSRTVAGTAMFVLGFSALFT